MTPRPFEALHPPPDVPAPLPCRRCGQAPQVVRWPAWQPPYAVRCRTCPQALAEGETVTLAVQRWNVAQTEGETSL